MRRYQLAKLVQLATKLRSRKRLQKVVFLLQFAGWPVEAEYRLHYFGPYSDDVAHVTDEMVQERLLEEDEQTFGLGQTYNYQLSQKARDSLPIFESAEEGKKALEEFQRFEATAKKLLEEDLKILECAATLVYFHRRAGLAWPEAVKKMCEMKKIRKNSPALRKADQLARELVPTLQEEE